MAVVIRTRLSLDRQAINLLLTGPTGPVLRFLRDVTREVRNRAVLRCPVDTGNLRNSIYERVEVSRIRILALVGSDVDYAAYVHEGTRAHWIRARAGHVLRFKIGNEVVFTRLVRHPGTKAQPFLRQAVEEAAVPRGFRIIE